jgi:hypothetical protein
VYVEQYSQHTKVYAGAFHVGGVSFGQKNRQYVVHASIEMTGSPTNQKVAEELSTRRYPSKNSAGNPKIHSQMATV